MQPAIRAHPRVRRDASGHGAHIRAAALTLQVERGWPDMKTILDLRPVSHHLGDRIRDHVLLCRLALLLIRVAENTADRTWPGHPRRAQQAAHRHVHSLERPRRGCSSETTRLLAAT